MVNRVLVIDDDRALSEMLGIVLRAEGFDVDFCERGDTAFAAFRSSEPNVVLLDLMLPGRDGVEVCRQIRTESGVPIVMLTAKGDTVDVVTGLEAGADDYVVKPFKPKELIARLKACLRRPVTTQNEALRVGDLAIDASAHTVTRDGVLISLTPLEFDLLLAMARQPWQAFSREKLLSDVWGYQHPGDARLVSVHVQRLRAKIEKDPNDPQIVVTVRGVGYKVNSG
ncbi:MAG: response regulator transcription factor [Actinobacteria bacterium]|nr:response regulator transcription factor [Actinomycetota bacterium]